MPRVISKEELIEVALLCQVHSIQITHKVYFPARAAWIARLLKVLRVAVLTRQQRGKWRIRGSDPYTKYSTYWDSEGCPCPKLAQLITHLCSSPLSIEDFHRTLIFHPSYLVLSPVPTGPRNGLMVVIYITAPVQGNPGPQRPITLPH